MPNNKAFIILCRLPDPHSSPLHLLLCSLLSSHHSSCDWVALLGSRRSLTLVLTICFRFCNQHAGRDCVSFRADITHFSLSHTALLKRSTPPDSIPSSHWQFERGMTDKPTADGMADTSPTQDTMSTLPGQQESTDSRFPRHIVPVASRRRPRPALEPILTRMQYRLAPLHPLPEGPPHPEFPKAILNYHLLTERQLDDIAQYYHQWTRSPCIWTDGYPANANWNHEFLQHLGSIKGDEHRCNVKRRKFGRFIGLPHCETPVEETDELERWLSRRQRQHIKSAGDFAFHGRRGFGNW